MAQSISVNVYSIDGTDVTAKRYGFPASSVFETQSATSKGISIYGIVKTGGKSYGVVETVAALVALANA